ncbi:ATP-binding protein [Actinophytocola sediminis]
MLVAGSPVALPERLRSLLAALALSVDRSVSVDELARAIWGEDLPSRVRGSVQTAVMRLRQTVGEDVIATGPAGYRLTATSTDLDAFRRLLDRARTAADPRAERELLAEAVALWRDEPLGGVASATLRTQYVPQLEEQFLTAVERRVDLDRAAGGAAELCAELRALTERFPLREPLWERLIRALVGAGRNAEALSVFARCRDLLAEQLGVEPNARLRQLHLELLRAADEPPTAPAPAIPEPLTRLFGRDDEVAALVDRLTTGPQRLITLTGVAGIGKTRLALAAAHAVAARGVTAWWVPLSPVPRAELVLPAIAYAVNAPEVSVAGIGQRMAGRLTVLVVDNLEHLDGVGAVLADLLGRLPGLRVLATSRAPVGVAGEQEWLVPGLPVPADGPGGLDGVAEVASVALFVDRVQAVTPSFELTDVISGAVVDICRRLHGLPLGLELAAGQWRVRGAAVAESVREAPLDLHAVGDRHERRHGSLRDAIAASCALLDDDVLDTLCRLAAFQGGWTYDLAVHATGDGLLARLDRLVSLGLVHITDTATGRRFAMVPTIQTFAAARALERGVADAAAAAHANAVARWVELTRERTPDRARTHAAFDAERANLLAAHRWFADHDPKPGLVLIATLSTYWRARERDEELLASFLSFLGLAIDAEAVAATLADTAIIDISVRDGEQAVALTERALVECRRRGDRRGQVYALTLLGWLTRQFGLASATRWHRAAVDVAADGEPLLLGQALLHLAAPLADLGRYVEAEELLDRAVDLATSHEHPFVLFDALLCRAELRRRHDNPDGAAEALDQARPLFDRTGDPATQTFWHAQAAVLATGRGDLEVADEHVAKAIARTGGGHVPNRCACSAWWARGEILLRSGDRNGAAEAFRRSLAENPYGRSDRVVETLVGLAEAVASAEVAATALTVASGLRERDGLVLPPPVARRFRAAGDRWAESVDGSTWHTVLAEAERGGAEDYLVVLGGLVAR